MLKQSHGASNFSMCSRWLEKQCRDGLYSLSQLYARLSKDDSAFLATAYNAVTKIILCQFLLEHIQLLNYLFA